MVRSCPRGPPRPGAVPGGAKETLHTLNVSDHADQKNTCAHGPCAMGHAHHHGRHQGHHLGHGNAHGPWPRAVGQRPWAMASATTRTDAHYHGHRHRHRHRHPRPWLHCREIQDDHYLWGANRPVRNSHASRHTRARAGKDIQSARAAAASTMVMTHSCSHADCHVHDGSYGWPLPWR